MSVNIYYLKLIFALMSSISKNADKKVVLPDPIFS